MLDEPLLFCMERDTVVVLPHPKLADYYNRWSPCRWRVIGIPRWKCNLPGGHWLEYDYFLYIFFGSSGHWFEYDHFQCHIFGNGGHWFESDHFLFLIFGNGGHWLEYDHFAFLIFGNGGPWLQHDYFPYGSYSWQWWSLFRLWSFSIPACFW